MHDQLTGLANRLQFTGQLRDAIRRAREEIHPVTLLYMDLDGFKPVDDEFGHDIGDQLLVAVAKRPGLVHAPARTPSPASGATSSRC